MEEMLKETRQPDPQDSHLEAFPPLLQWEITLNPCPWCGKTPYLSMFLESLTGGTWVWKIYCINYDCAFKPEGRHVAIRKSQRFDLDKIKEKLDRLCAFWNVCDKYKPYEKLEIPLDEWFKFVEKHK